MSRTTKKDPKELERCVDSYGRVHALAGEISRGGQGAVFRTGTPNVVVKFELRGDENGPIDSPKYLVSANENAKYMELRFLPIPKSAHVTMPLATLQKYGGYVMQMMSDMLSFQQSFDEFGRKGEDRMKIETPFTRRADAKTDGFFSDYISTGGERRRLEAYMKSAALLAQLHSRGLVYCDYSQNNVFISKNMDHCNVWLIDADNLAYESRTVSGALFTPGLAAPEVFLFWNELGKNVPLDDCTGRGNSFASDAYTFAMCLFKQLAGCSPFKGAAFDEAAQKFDSADEGDILVQTGQFAYIADPDDSSNRGYPLPLDAVLSPELKELFRQTFCQEGRDNCLSRPGMCEWAEELARAHDWSLHCNVCGMDYISEEDRKCPWCDETMPALLTAESTYAEHTRGAPPLWRFRRELKNGAVSLPLRLAHGYDANELDKKLLTAFFENGEMILRVDVTDPNLEILYSDDGQNFAAYRTIKAPPKCFYLRCKNVARHSDVLVKCEVSS